MIAIKINGQTAQISQNQKLEITTTIDALNVDSNFGEFSLAIEFYLQKNEGIFGFLYEPTRANNLPNDYDCEIIWNGLPFKKGKFLIQKFTNETIQGVFLGNLLDLYRFKDSKLSEILTQRLNYEGLALATLNAHLPIGSNVVFPTVLFSYFNDGDLRDNTQANTYSSVAYVDSNYIAMMKVFYCLELIFNTLGYNVDNDVTENAAALSGKLQSSVELSKIIIFSNYLTKAYFVPPLLTLSLPNFDLKNYVPKDLTISEFLQDLRKCFGIVCLVNSNNNRVRITTFDLLLTQNNPIDWSVKVSPNFQVQKQDIKTFQYKFTPNADDLLQQENATTFKGYTVGQSVLLFSNLPTATFTDFNQKVLRLVITENKYYTASVVNNAYVWVFYSDGNLPYNEVDDTYLIDCKASSLRMSQFVIKEYNQNISIGNQGGLVRLSFSQEQIFVIGRDAIQVVEPSIYAGTFANITNISNSNRNFVINIPFIATSAAGSVKIQVKTPIDYLPNCGTLPDNNQTNLLTGLSAFQQPKEIKNTLRYLIYHGLQVRKNTNDTYPYAASHNYNAREQKIVDNNSPTLSAELTLRWETSLGATVQKGIVDIVLKNYIEQCTYLEEFQFDAFLSITDLRELPEVILVRGQKFWIKSVTYQLGEAPIQRCKLVCKKFLPL